MRWFLSIILSLLVVNAKAQNKQFYLLVGTYTTDIHVYKFNTADASLKFISKVSNVENPSYLTVTRDGKFVYAVNENKSENKAAVSALSFDKAKGVLQLINTTPSGGDGPCYVDVDSTGKNVVVANYGGGTLSSFKTNADGSLQPAAQTIEHQGYSVNFTRQSKPHVHCTVFSPDGKYVFSNDLGTDKIYRYKFDANAVKPLNEDDFEVTEVPDGSGPRHITFHPNGKYAYVINELLGTVIAYEYNDGKLKEIQNIVSDNTGGKEDKGSADIHITPDGKYLYASNRAKANDITVFRVGSTGLLTEVSHVSTMGVHPRNFAIDPTGRFLLVANRDSNNIVVFSIIKSTGFLQPANMQISVDKPVCLKFADIK
ncbi:MAG: lactonase family protein [Sphingobacteriia bacterium]|nr:lactonase family protein [Sphingobacteriia bacterium]